MQFEADSYYNADSGKYDIEGPKNLFDAKMMSDWLLKICTDHPLVTYLEDGIRCNDHAGWKAHIAAFKEKNVRVGVNSWFQSNLEAIKQNTQFVEIEAPDEPEELEEDEATKEDMAKTGSAMSAVTSPKSALEVKDPNEEKIIPSNVHMSRCFDKDAPQNAVQWIADAAQYCTSLKDDEAFTLIYDDYQCEN